MAWVSAANWNTTYTKSLRIYIPRSHLLLKLSPIHYNTLLTSYEINFHIRLAALAQMVACLPLVQRVRDSIPDEVVNFHLKIFNLRTRRDGDVHFLITRLYITDLNKIPNPSAVCTLRRHIVLLIVIRPSDGDVKAWRPPWCFSRRAGYEPAPGFIISLPFIIIPHSTTQLHKQLHI